MHAAERPATTPIRPGPTHAESRGPEHATGPTLRERLEAALAAPPGEAAVEAEAELVELADEHEPEPQDEVVAEPAEPAEAPADATPLTTRERIVLHAQVAAAAETAASESAAPEPVAAPVVARVEPVAAPEPEPEPEPEEETLAIVVALDAEKQRLAARAARVEPEDAAGAEPEGGVSAPDNVVPFAPRRAPAEGTAETDAPAPDVAAVARGPPARAELLLSPLPIVQAKLAVSNPGDPLEREADAVADCSLRGGGLAARSIGSGPASVLRAASARAPPSAGSGLPRNVAAVLAAPGGGAALDPALRSRIEPHVGVDLGGVRIRRDSAAAAAARELRARAFTSGSTIFLAAESSPSDVALMAHEAAHVAQQQTVAAARTTLLRDVTDYLPDVSVEDVIPDWILDGVRDAVRAIPGYTLLTYIVGRDPLLDEPVTAGRDELIETLLTYGPFGAAVGTVLQAIDVLGQVFDFISQNLEANDLTLARIQRDVENAWDELSVTNGIAGNVAIVRRYVDNFLRDVGNFVASIVEQVLEMVRAVVADFAEPLLETPEIAPVWNLTKKVLHYDPLRGVAVEAPTAEIIADFLRLMHEEQRLAQMEERGTLQETADWLDTQLIIFFSLIIELGTLFSDAWAAIQPENLPDLFTNLETLAQRAFGFIQRVGEFVATLLLQILELIKNSLLEWLSEHAHSIPGFHLLTVILERNPFTGEAVPRTAQNLIKGFITLMPDGEATYDQLAEAGVISDAAARIESAMSELGISWELITGTFLGIWDSLQLDDLLDPIGAFERVLAQFGEPLARIVRFVGVVIEVVITLILRLMNFPSDLLGSIIANALQAIEDIKRDPVGFLLNMLEAVKLGFTGFLDNILTYLVQGLADWLFRGLRQLGITIPTDLSLQSVLTLVLEVLGITAEMLWTKLGEHIGPERVEQIRSAINMLSGAWSFIRDVQEGGVGAIWRYVTDQLSGLWDTLLGMARDWIVETVITRVTARLLTMLDPTGVMAVVNSFIAFFNAVQSAIEYLREILEIINRYVETLAQIAAGNIVPGAQMLERGLASAIPVAIGFLANQVGLGNVPEKIVEIIQRLRELVDQALDWLFEQAIRLGQSVLAALGIGGRAAEPAAAEEAEGEEGANVGLAMAGTGHELTVAAGQPLMMASDVRTAIAALLEQELEVLNETQDALSASSAADKDEALAVVARQILAVQAMQRQVNQINAAVTSHGPDHAVVAEGMTILRTLAQDYGRQYGRRRLGGPALWGITIAGTTAEYGRHPAAAGLIREHVVPAAVFAAMIEARRTDPEFRPVDRGLTTVAWDENAAHLKTHGSVTVDSQVFHLANHVGDNAATDRAKAQMDAGRFDLSAFIDDRVGAAQEAASLLGLTTPSASAIAQAGHIELQRMWELMPTASRR